MKELPKVKFIYFIPIWVFLLLDKTVKVGKVKNNIIFVFSGFENLQITNLDHFNSLPESFSIIRHMPNFSMHFGMQKYSLRQPHRRNWSGFSITRFRTIWDQKHQNRSLYFHFSRLKSLFRRLIYIHWEPRMFYSTKHGCWYTTTTQNSANSTNLRCSNKPNC